MSWWNRLLLFGAALLLRFLSASLRLIVEDHSGVVDNPNRDPVILAFWHNRLLLLAYYYEQHCPGFTPLAFISPSRDGQMISAVAGHFGVKTTAGSTSKQGARAALKAVRAIKDQDRVDICITPDGPRGPCYELQPGVLVLAQLTGRKIVPTTYHLAMRWELNSWDKFQIPVPFTACRLILGKPIEVPRDATPEQMEQLAQELSQKLSA